MKRLKSPDPHDLLLNTISYFAFFGYPPDFDEIFAFFPGKTTKKDLSLLLDRLLRRKKLVKSSAGSVGSVPGTGKRRQSRTSRTIQTERYFRNIVLEHGNNPDTAIPNRNAIPLNYSLYTLPQYSIAFKNRASRGEITKNKLGRVRGYLKALARSPFIRLAGISGSASMLNCRKGDDVDIFIVSERKRLFLARFWAILLAVLYGVRQGSDSVCLNLFMDEGDMKAPASKQNIYVAHEILQMKPLINKNFTWERFMKSNCWIYTYFPNAKKIEPPADRTAPLSPPILWLPEQIMSFLQRAIIRKNRTGYMITPTQLWLFKKDFERRLKNKL